jgi:hypothetical protein
MSAIEPSTEASTEPSILLCSSLLCPPITPSLQTPSHTEDLPPSVDGCESVLQNEQNEPQTPSTTRKKIATYSKAFLEWYESYPRHENKQDAASAYGRAITRIASEQELTQDAARAWLLQRTSEFAHSPAGQRGKYTPFPATWLNRGGYDSDPKEWYRNNGEDPRGTMAAAERFLRSQGISPNGRE